MKAARTPTRTSSSGSSPEFRAPGGAVRPSTSLTRWMIILLAILVVLALLPSVASIWFYNQAGQTSDAMRQAVEQSAKLSDIQQRWLNVVDTLATLAAGANPTETQLQLDSRLGALDRSLTELAETKLGENAQMQSRNKALADELVRVGEETRSLSGQVYNLTVQKNWAQADNTRRDGMARLQARLGTTLLSLNQNLLKDVDLRAQQVQVLRTNALLYSAITTALAIIFAAVLVYASQRGIIAPLRRLTLDVRRITSGDFSPITPLTRRDEIGELSQDMALMTEWLRESVESLERRVADRTKEVERRRNELQVAAQVARDIASTRQLDTLLNLAVNLIRDRFGFYHAGLFLSDNRGEWAVLRAATGEAGRDMLNRSHQLRIGQVGLVGFAARNGEARVSDDVNLDAVHYKNPLLPDTRSEAAIPLKTGGRVIGVLDVQSTSPKAFDEESLQVLQVLADQLATAIQNARLLEEVQQNLAELQIAYGQVDRQTWERFIQGASLVGFQYDGVSMEPLYPQSQPAGETGAAPLRMPLQVRGSDIGALEVWSQEGQLSENETALLQTITSRLGQVLESARLFEETQLRAAREQTINRLTAGISRSLDTDSVLRTAAVQLGDLPSVTEVSVYLSGGSPPGAEKGDQPVISGENNGGDNGHRP